MDQMREVRISVHGLEPGMYVSRLDRPWMETRFPLQGVLLRTPDEVEDLRRVCSYVYIDTVTGKGPDPRYLVFDSPGGSSDSERREIAAIRKTTRAVESSFDVELQSASTAHQELEHSIDEVMQDLQHGRHVDLRRLKEGVDAMIDSILRNPAAFTWLKELKRRDDYAYQHAMGSAIWAASFGRHLGLERGDLRDLALGGLLCDVGKTRIPVDLLTRTGGLGDDEKRLVRDHVRHSVDIVRGMSGLSVRIVEMVHCHHERHDGSGYPRGLKGSDIPIFGRIMGLVDSYDAMTCTRPYASSRSPHQAVAELYELRGRLFQAELVEQFIQTCGIYPTGSLVELSSGQVGVITAVHSLKRLRPQVMLLLDRQKRPLAQFHTIDLSVVETDDEGMPLTVKSGLPSGAYGIDPHELFID